MCCRGVRCLFDLFPLRRLPLLVSCRVRNVPSVDRELISKGLQLGLELRHIACT